MPINEPVLEAFLHSRDGPIGRFVENIAVDTANIARDKVRDIFRGSPEVGDELAQQVTYRQEGIEAIIGIEDDGDPEHRLQHYLAEKAVREQPGWLEGALQEATPT